MSPTPTPFINPTSFPAAKFGSLGTIINLVVPVIMVGVAIVFLIMLIQGAFYLIMGEGKPEAIAKASKTMIMAIVGLVTIIAAFLIVKLIGVIMNVNLLL